MANWMACRPGRRVLHGGSCLAAIAVLTVMAGESIVAQTLIGPNSQSKSFPPALTAKKPPSAQRVNPCSTYGAGFVQIPGSDACVKIGGSVTVEGATH